MLSKVDSFFSQAQAILKNYPSFKRAELDDEKNVHKIYESTKMKLANNLSLFYSRKPSLKESFHESLHIPLLVLDHQEHSFLASINQNSQVFNGISESSYYSSDLRISPKAKLKTRIHFRNCYQDMVKAIPQDHKCTTVILEENKAAIQSLTSKKSPLTYNEMFRYISQTLLVFPTLNLGPKKLKNLNLIKLKDHPKYLSKLHQYLKVKQTHYQYSNDFIKFQKESNSDEYILVNNQDEIKGYLSLFRPKYRSILVESNSLWIKSLLKIMSLLFKTDYTQKLPWVYLNAYILDDDIESSSLKDRLIRKLYSLKAIKTGEILLMAVKKNLYQKPKLFCPHFVNGAIMYHVGTEKKDFKIEGKVHLNLAEL